MVVRERATLSSARITVYNDNGKMHDMPLPLSKCYAPDSLPLTAAGNVGHYTALLGGHGVTSDGGWRRFDDESVSPCEQPSPDDESLGQNAVLLFYRQRGQ